MFEKLREGRKILCKNKDRGKGKEKEGQRVRKKRKLLGVKRQQRSCWDPVLLGSPHGGPGSFLLQEWYQELKRHLKKQKKLRNYIPKE